MKRTVIIFTTFLLCFFIAIVFSKFVPYNMDEFLHYHPISCIYYGNNDLNIYESGCQRDYLTVFGAELPLLAYDYVGSLRAALYYPLFMIWKSPVSARFFGLLFIVAQAVILSRIFKIRYFYVLFGLLLFFPYFYMNIADTGPVGLHLTAVFLIIYLLNKWKEEQKSFSPYLIGGISFLAIWEKPIFLIYSLPLLLLFISNRPNRTMIKQAIIPLLITVTLVIILFYGINYKNEPYFTEIISRSSTSGESLVEKITGSPILYSLINPYYATHRVYEVRDAGIIAIFYSVFILLSPFLVGRRRKEYLLYFALFILQITLLVLLDQASSMHHTILAYPFLIMSFLYSLDPKRIKAWLAIFIGLNIILFLTFTSQKVYTHSDSSILEINKLINNHELAEEYHYVVMAWGAYYTQALYGPSNQSVLFMPSIPDKSSFPPQLSGKKLLFITENNEFTIEYLKRKKYSIKKCYEGKWLILVDSSVCHAGEEGNDLIPSS